MKKLVMYLLTSMAFILYADELFMPDSPIFIHALAYNSEDNFMKQNVYGRFGRNKCELHNDLLPNIQKLESILKTKKLKLIFYDCFRPNEIQRYMWEIIPNPKYVANPYKNGSMHTRGIALDVALADINGNVLEFPSKFDEFNNNAWSDYECDKKEQKKCKNRDLLQSIMKQAGFRSIHTEWWHFEIDHKGDKQELFEHYPLLEK